MSAHQLRACARRELAAQNLDTPVGEPAHAGKTRALRRRLEERFHCQARGQASRFALPFSMMTTMIIVVKKG